MIWLLASCEEKNIESTSVPSSPDLSYEMDTVLIQAEGEELYLRMNLAMSDYSPHEGLLYNLVPEAGRVEVIDLNEHRLDTIIQYALRGPNSIKENYPSGIKKSILGDTYFSDFSVIHRINPTGTKVETYKLNGRLLSGDKLPYETQIDGMGEIARDGSYFASFYGKFRVGGNILGIAKVDLTKKSVKLIPINFWNELKEYNITVNYRLGRRSSSTELRYLTLNGPDIIFSTSATNEIWYYDAETDSVFRRKYQSSFTSDQKKGDYIKEVTDQQSFEYWIARKNEEVLFGPLVKDHESQKFYRFSRELDKNNPDKPNFIHVLTVFDAKLDQTHEVKLKSKINLSGEYFAGKTFVHKGGIYSYFNLNNEMAFLRLTPDFETVD